MPRYISLHSLACLTRQGAEQLAIRLAAATGITAQRIQVNMVEGKMLVEIEAPDRETAEAWFRAEHFHYDWLMRVEWEFEQGKLKPIT
jgi:hypothetical protein